MGEIKGGKRKYHPTQGGEFCMFFRLLSLRFAGLVQAGEKTRFRAKQAENGMVESSG
jgi:hypothetical protein